MDSTRIIQQGEEAKFFIDISNSAFSMADDDFKVTLQWGMLGRSLTIKKSEMTADSSGRYFFLFDTAEMTGRVKAVCTYYIPDTDDADDDSVREKVDVQYLCFVVANTACPKLIICSCDNTDREVTYERTHISSIASKYQRLCDCDGHPLASDDDLYFYVLTEKADEVQAAIDALTDE